MTAKELMWQLVFFPLWGIIGGILLFGLTVLEIFTKRRLGLPRFRGQARSWDQGIWSDRILSSSLG